MSVFDNSIINQIQQAVDIVDIVSEHVSLKKKGREMVGLCPFHEDHSPSLCVNPVKQIFKCFACGAGGDVFKFIQLRENLTFPQAIERLAQRAGIKVKKSVSASTGSKDAASAIDPNILANINLWAAKHFQKNLFDERAGSQARNYVKERQITKESVLKWQIGLALSQNDLLNAAKAKGFSAKLLKDAGLAVQDKAGGFSDKFVNRLMFAISDVTGRIIGFGGRTLDENGAKYINSPTTALFDKSNSLYGLEHARHTIVSTGTAVVVEGYTDCIMAHQYGCSNVVATLGTSLTDGHGRLLRRYAKTVVLFFDSDNAGIEAANRALDVCLNQHIDIKLGLLNDAKDPCDFLLSKGKDSFEKLISQAADVFQFKWDRLAEKFRADSTFADKKTAVDEFLQTIAISLHTGNVSAVDRGLIINRIANVVGMDIKQINAELAKRIEGLKRTQKNRSAMNIANQKVQNLDLGKGLSANAQREILEVLLNEPDLFEIAKKTVKVEDFTSTEMRLIASLLFERLKKDSESSLRTILAGIESADTAAIVVELAENGREKGNFKRRLLDALDVLGRCRARQNIRSTTKDDKEFLKNVAENIAKKNPHNIGMI